MTKEKILKIRRQWGQWKRYRLSKTEKKNLSMAMYLDFLCSNGYECLLK